MRLKNPATLNSIQNVIKINQPLSGAKDGVNCYFQTPSHFLFSLENSPMVDINGKSAYLGKDIKAFIESGGPGTGFDTVEFQRPPKRNWELLITYIEDL